MFINNVKQQTQDKFIDDWAEKITYQNRQAKLRTNNIFSYPKLAMKLIAAVFGFALAPIIWE